MKIRRSLLSIAGVGMLLACSSPITYAQQRPNHSKEPASKASLAGKQNTLASGEGQNTAKPDNIIALRVKGPDESWARASVIEGGALRVANKKTGMHFAFFPAVDSTNKKNVIIRVGQFHKSDAGEKFEELESLNVSIGASKTTTTTPSFDIQVEAIAKHFPKEGEPFKVSKVKNKDTNKPPQH